MKPPHLRRGDLIGLVSPASAPMPAEKIQQAVVYLESLGYRTKIGTHAAATYGYLAGKDEERAADFNQMAADPQVKAIFATRGGYGSPRLLDQIDYPALQHNPKIIVGFSDITALQLAIFRKIGLVTFSGPLPAVEFCKNPDPYAEENFWRLLISTKRIGELRNPTGTPLHWKGDSAAEGILLGGNLSLVVSLLGTPFSPSYKDALLALEDVGEEPYRIDRMFTQLRNARVLERLNGLVLGQFTNCENKDTKKPSFSLDEVLSEVRQAHNWPSVSNLQYGHLPKKLTLPLGLRARLHPGPQKFEILESAVC
jgi:muramoyltetrapeptide carboxypeptidase